MVHGVHPTELFLAIVPKTNWSAGNANAKVRVFRRRPLSVNLARRA